MSGIVALVAPAGETIDRRLVEPMLEAQRHRGPDGSSIWTGGNVALGFVRLAVTAEDAGAEQPRAARSGALRAVFDGRLDNRDELIAAARASGCEPATAADVDVLLAAYDAWGAECARHLLGDFAFAIWDAPRRTLVCGRDVLGGRPLYVHARNGRSQSRQRSRRYAAAGFARQPNDAFVAECLTGQIVSRTDTVWRDVVRLEPAHLLIVEDGRPTRRRYWQPDTVRDVRYQRDEEYADHLADLLRRAIAPRLRAAGRAGVMLSGGIDSSSIVGAIHQMGALNGSGP